jgi:hypothetical protein
MPKNAARLLTIAALLSVSATAKNSAPIFPKDGDYLSTAYIAVLDKTKSHRKASDTPAPQEIDVSRDNQGLELFIGYNWHEANKVAFDQNNPARPVGAERDDRAALFPIDATQFKYREDKAVLTYQYVGNVLRFITEKILAGRYVDARGRRYVFGLDGKAQIPDRTFRYELYLDMIFEPTNEFTDLDASKPNHFKNYGFEWRGGALYIYKANCESDKEPGCIIDKKSPLAVLHKKRPAGK